MLLYIIVVFITVLVVLDRWKPRKFKKMHDQLGCDFLYLPIIGHCHIFFGAERRIRNYIDIAHQCYKNKHGMISFWLANRLFVGISDPMQAKVVLKTCLDKGVLAELGVEVLGYSSIFAPVEEWRHRRKIMSAILAPRVIKNFVEIFSRHSEDVCDKLRSEVSKGEFSIWEHIFGYSLDLISEASTGINKNLKDQRHHPVYKAVEESMQNLIRRIAQPWQHIDTIYKWTSDYKRQTKNKNMLQNFTKELISEKKRKMKTEKIITKEKDTLNFNKTLLELMMEYSVSDNNYTDVEVLEELVLLVIAAVDTTTSGAGFICVVLSLYPDVQEKAFKEIKKIFENSNRRINLDDLEKLEYIQAIIKESLRLYPPGPAILRKCDENVELPTGIILEKDTSFFINILGINRNPHYWGPDAEEFRPERFLEGAPIHPAAFMSFSYGPRNCVGQNFGMMALKILITNILRCYRLKPATCYADAKEVKFSVDIMLRPTNDFKVKIEPREYE